MDTNTNDLLTDYGTDLQLEQDGAWDASFRSGIEMKMRSPQAKEVKKAYANVNKRNEKYAKTNTEVPENVKNKNLTEIAVAAVADWRRRTTVVTNGQPVDHLVAALPCGGVALDCTEANRQTVFSHPQLWSLRLDVVTRLNDIDRFRVGALEEDAGNSDARSAPSSNSGATLNA